MELRENTYFDAVLDVNMKPLFNGSPQEVVEWLVATAQDWRMQQNAQICVGRTLEMKSIDDYTREYDASRR